jgi:hypothetical protein
MSYFKLQHREYQALQSNTGCKKATCRCFRAPQSVLPGQQRVAVAVRGRTFTRQFDAARPRANRGAFGLNGRARIWDNHRPDIGWTSLNSAT